MLLTFFISFVSWLKVIVEVSFQKVTLSACLESFGSDYCQRAAGLLVCKNYFPLCDECHSGQSYMASREECERISMVECEEDWATARQYGISLPNCTDVPEEVKSEKSGRWWDHFPQTRLLLEQLFWDCIHARTLSSFFYKGDPVKKFELHSQYKNSHSTQMYSGLCKLFATKQVCMVILLNFYRFFSKNRNVRPPRFELNQPYLQRRLLWEEFHLPPSLRWLGWETTECSCCSRRHCRVGMYYFATSHHRDIVTAFCYQKKGFVSWLLLTVSKLKHTYVSTCMYAYI